MSSASRFLISTSDPLKSPPISAHPPKLANLSSSQSLFFRLITRYQREEEMGNELPLLRKGKKGRSPPNSHPPYPRCWHDKDSNSWQGVKWTRTQKGRSGDFHFICCPLSLSCHLSLQKVWLQLHKVETTTTTKSEKEEVRRTIERVSERTESLLAWLCFFASQSCTALRRGSTGGFVRFKVKNRREIENRCEKVN